MDPDKQVMMQNTLVSLCPCCKEVDTNLCRVMVKRLWQSYRTMKMEFRTTNSNHCWKVLGTPFLLGWITRFLYADDVFEANPLCLYCSSAALLLIMASSLHLVDIGKKTTIKIWLH